MFSPVINQLIERLNCLPGVGKKSAQRMAMYLLEHDRQGGLLLAEGLQEALTKVKNCQSCRNLTEYNECHICTDLQRDKSLICIVESPADVIAIEQCGSFRGYYFVLMGHLSPIDGVGPKELGITDLIARAQGHVEEVILATNPTVEGEATANYITEKLKPLGICVSRIAHGVPVGGELEYIDGGTLSHALLSRKQL
ncbi:MAG: recombination protein RecR [Pseudomonadales bacterium]|nr:recombination protein RecR [Pseudomonadales bacterium]